MQSMQHILIIVWLAFCAIVGHVGGMHHNERVLGRVERRATWLYMIVLVLPLIYWTGTRNLNYGDGWAYFSEYREIPMDLAGKIQYVREASKDRGFYALNAIISCFFPANRVAYCTVLALIHIFFLAKTYRKYSVDFWLAMFVFVASTDYISWMHNGLRQFTAVVIIFASSGWLFKKKLVPFCIAVCFASLFHQSALMMIPIAFIVQGKAWNWKTLVVIFFSVLAIAFVGTFTGMLGSALEDTQYRNVISDWQAIEDDGTNPIRVLVYAVPTIISLLAYGNIKHCKDRVVHICCNMGIVSTALYVISMFTSGVYIGRLPIYCSLYANGILLPWELKHIFNKSTGAVIRILAIVCYLGFYAYQMHFAWGFI